MTRHHKVNNIKVPFTAEEEAARDAEEAQYLIEQKSKPIIKEYQTNRKNEYPEIGDQLDMLWHSIDQDAALKSKYFAFHQAILAVKSKYPK
jgi:hypothetical protein|tara:strand:- start:350 stop:622 length:273 start_codon:yes stop_codon:yes gene_type:complete